MYCFNVVGDSCENYENEVSCSLKEKNECYMYFL